MPNDQPIHTADRFQFLNNVPFTKALPLIQESDCAILSAERAGFTFDENAARTEALRTRFLDAFRRGKESLVFDLRMADGKEVPPRDRRRRYLLVAERPAFTGKREDNPFLERTIEICRLFHTRSFIFIPHPESAAEVAAEIVSVGGEIAVNSPDQAQIRTACIVGDRGKIEIYGGEERLAFQVEGLSPIVTGSMNNAYLMRALNAKRFPGAPSRS